MAGKLNYTNSLFLLIAKTPFLIHKGHTLVTAHHAYEPQREDELALSKGDIVTVTDSSDPDWWVGKKDDGSSGFFPSNVSLSL